MTGRFDSGRCRTALAPWRLRKATTYVEANLSLAAGASQHGARGAVAP
ncbi:hypothetical protein QN219_24200 [Sinorhizobium sp. 7-81]|nr:hypothetical protein [Sinorhizobium sp. 8-89]MDK1493110.1 hypothetical protein [Sinorhizobium sp. 8-89]